MSYTLITKSSTCYPAKFVELKTSYLYFRFVYTDCNYALAKREFFLSSFAFIFPEDSAYLPVFNSK